MHSGLYRTLILVCILLTPTWVAAQEGQPNTGNVPKPEDLTPDLGVASIPDRETFEKLSYQGPMRMDSYLSNIECVKFIITGVLTDNSNVYWMNTNNFQAHPQFMGRIGLGGGRGGMGRGGFGGGGGGPGGGGPVDRA